VYVCSCCLFAIVYECTVPPSEQQTAAADKASVACSVAVPVDLSSIVASYAVTCVQWDARMGGVPDALVELSADGRAALMVQEPAPRETQGDRHWPWVVSAQPISAMALVSDAPQLRRWWIRVDRVGDCIGVGVCFPDMNLRDVRTANSLSCGRSWCLSTASSSLFHGGQYTDEEPPSDFRGAPDMPSLLRFTADLSAGTVSVGVLIPGDSLVSARVGHEGGAVRCHGAEAAADVKNAARRGADDTVWVRGLKDLSTMHVYCCFFARGSAVCLLDREEEAGPPAMALPLSLPSGHLPGGKQPGDK
jgi:hypothetical protein